MAVPAAEPATELDRPRPGRHRPTRIAGLLLALAAGTAALGVGIARTAGGIAGVPSNAVAVGSSAAAVAGSSGGTSAHSGLPGSAPSGPASSVPPPSGAPGSSVGAPGSSIGQPSPSPSIPPGPGSSSAPPPPAPGVAPTPDVARRLQAALDRARVRLGIPGVSATVLLGNGTTWTGVSGFAVVASRTKVVPDTAFAFASVSKTFTSALILQLIGEGRFRLTDSAVGLLPPLRLRIDPRITVGMLLNHRSGLADYFLNPKIDGPLQGHPSAAWTVDRTLRYVGKRLSAPGAAWHYSNTNYLLLGLIAERVTGQTLADAIRTRLLEPNGLDATWYEAGEPGRAPLAHGYRIPRTPLKATPVDLDDGSGIAPFRSVVTASAGAGSMAGTSGDLARWGRALYSGRVLGPTGTAMLLSGFSKTTNYLPGVVYGYGVQAFSIDGHPTLGHSGRFLGFRAVVRHFPLDGLTIAVLTNQSRADPAAIVRALLAVAEAASMPSPCVMCPRPS